MAPGDDLRYLAKGAALLASDMLAAPLRTPASMFRTPQRRPLRSTANYTLDAIAPPFNVRSTKGPPHELWQDRDVLFSVSAERGTSLRPGEEKVDDLFSVEDAKGGRGERGTLTVTNLRIIWISHKRSKNM